MRALCFLATALLASLVQHAVSQRLTTAQSGSTTLILVAQNLTVPVADIYCLESFGGHLASLNTDADYAAAHALLWQALASSGPNFVWTDCGGSPQSTYCAAFGLTTLLSSPHPQHLDATDAANMLSRPAITEFASNVRGLAAVLCQSFLINSTVAFRDPDVARPFFCKTARFTAPPPSPPPPSPLPP
ncbi:hypothetical protein QJQ45_029660, partial [Haematococcus lacustris]